MHGVAEDVFQLPLAPRNAINAYLLGDVLVDAGLRSSAQRILAALGGRTIAAHAITHAHADHAGASRRIAETLGVEVWIGAGDAGALEAGVPVAPGGRGAGLIRRLGRFPGMPPTRLLVEGDAVGAGFTVLDAPGHSPGQIALWREHDRTLVCGDVWFNMNVVTTAYGLHEPLRLATVDPARNRESARRLAALEPALVLFGHGPPLRDPTRLLAFTTSLAR